MAGKNKQQWIEKGYQIVSENGFTNINIEFIARVLHKNKSSFYHYFGDSIGFEEALLAHHLMLAKQFALEVKNCPQIIPGLIDIFLEHKIDIFFHKNLRIHREKSHYKKCFESAYNLFEEAVLDKWIVFLKLENYSFLSSELLRLISENFLLQITHENFTHTWLENYLLDISKLVVNLNRDSPPK
jgi:AcrR family transcriptional regulator